MIFHVTLRARGGGTVTTRVGASGSTAAAARRDAQRTAAARWGVPVANVVSAVNITPRRSYPSA